MEIRATGEKICAENLSTPINGKIVQTTPEENQENNTNKRDDGTRNEREI